MVIGIDASRAFLKKRTGIEEYSFQVIRHLRDVLPREHQVILYIRSGQEVNLELPKNWSLRVLSAPRLWTQVRLSLEMLLHKPDVLFIPAHTVPLIHPKRTIVTIHGLEYEFCPEGYSFLERIYMRLSIWYSCAVAQIIIAVSENTKRDLIDLYHVSESKIRVVYEGWSQESKAISETPIISKSETPFFLFIGRLEERKNIVRIIEAFESFKEATHLPHQLILVGKYGYGSERIEAKLRVSKWKKDILLPGYVGEDLKWELLQRATGFLFPTLYEGFGLPVLEAQSVGVPVITSTTSALPEVAGEGALLVDPMDQEAITAAMKRLVLDENLRTAIIEKGRMNALKFDWRKTSLALAEYLNSEV